ncbi:MAG: HAMP domain-containing protein [Nitrospira sp.]|jgi:two-component system nitrogen regulation sensor histidine kinase NtrY|uniref:histidine kinase n=1 Tax=Nitrospira defluvii TaxID=330214 RepID=D8PCL9_9BACT|nr:HAMP domain-containing protein [Nitrospira sp.]CBK40978.1 Sensor histidine kinase [Nitrospira defluvii]
MPESTDMTKLIPPGVLREKVPSTPASIESERRKRHVRPVWIVLILLLPCLALTFYYAQMAVPVGEESDSFFPSTGYAFVLLLVNLDLIGFVVLTLLLSRNLIKAYFERRHRLVGSGFRAKLVAAFIGFSLIPTVLLALVASGLVNKAVDVWFNDQIEHVMKDSYEVARMHHAGHVSLAINSARAISHEIFREELLLPEQRDLLVAAIARKRAEYATAGIEIFSSKMETLTKSLDPEVPVAVLDLPIGQLVLQVINGKQELTSVQEAQTGRLVRAGVPIASSIRRGEIDGVVVVDAYVPESLLGKMESIGRQYTEYKQMKAMKNPIKAGAYLLVAVITVMILFSATWFGFYVARGITVPIQRLAEATEAIAQGDLSVRIEAKATDEIGTLVESFNRMTADLQSSKTKVEEANVSLRQSNLELDRRRAYIETVVDTIAAGLLSIDRQGIITTFNPSAERMLGLWADRFRGRSANEVFKEYKLDLFQSVYDRMLVDQRDNIALEGQLDLQGRFLTIGVHCSRMKDESNKDLGFVLIFEDLSELIKAQKAAAWREVAQRIAHEIKNPLTPIQLSAQRLRKKFQDKAPDFDRICDESTQVIINEVGSLKQMLDEFSKFARMPAPHMTVNSLDDVVKEVVALYDSAHREVECVVTLDPDLPLFNFDREQIKRVLVNLCDNGIHAMNHKGHLWITTRYDTKQRRAVVTVADEGTGIAPEDQEKLFVPYFSRKKTGTGLGLAIVRRIVTDHDGQIHAGNHQPKGALFTFELPV